MVQFIQDNFSKPEFWEFLAASSAGAWLINSVLTTQVAKLAPNGSRARGWIRLAHGLLNRIDPEGNAK